MKIFIQLTLIACLAVIMVQAGRNGRGKMRYNCYDKYEEDVKKACGVWPHQLKELPNGRIFARCCNKPCDQAKIKKLCG